MDFCPKCGTRLTPKKIGEQTLMWCRKCGYTRKCEESDMIKFVKKRSREDLLIIPQETGLKTMPTVKRICPKCGNDTAYVWEVQTRSGDEPATQFYRCTKCGYTTRVDG
ncbi:transcription factor S [Candidatus Bathyarchaeota archaeon]|nr:transcription factor S [Candidatus Bathyarchaeota archaeon]